MKRVRNINCFEFFTKMVSEGVEPNIVEPRLFEKDEIEAILVNCLEINRNETCSFFLKPRVRG